MSIRIAAVQADLEWEDHETNRRRLADRMWGAAGAGARLVLLPEMFPTGFSMAAEEIAEPHDGDTVQWLADQASTHDLYVCGSLAMRPADGGRPRNTLVVAGPEGVVGTYDKIHPFAFAGETDHYDAGTEVLTVPLKGTGGDVVRTTFLICYDLRFADVFWDAAADTDLYVVVASWPSARRHHWQTLLTARAIENQAYVAACNRVGVDGNDVAYAGDSMVIDPLGQQLAAGALSETIVLADVDPAEVTRVREALPFMADRRPR